ncbi:MAG: hypothetical protein ABIG67_07490 [Pseudomonadota bacterium]
MPDEDNTEENGKVLNLDPHGKEVGKRDSLDLMCLHHRAKEKRSRQNYKVGDFKKIQE